MISSNPLESCLVRLRSRVVRFRLLCLRSGILFRPSLRTGRRKRLRSRVGCRRRVRRRNVYSRGRITRCRNLDRGRFASAENEGVRSVRVIQITDAGTVSLRDSKRRICDCRAVGARNGDRNGRGVVTLVNADLRRVAVIRGHAVRLDDVVEAVGRDDPAVLVHGVDEIFEVVFGGDNNRRRRASGHGRAPTEEVLNLRTDRVAGIGDRVDCRTGTTTWNSCMYTQEILRT